MENEKSHEVTLTSGGLKRMCGRSVIAMASECELQCYGGDWKEYHADVNSDTATVTRMASNLA